MKNANGTGLVFAAAGLLIGLISGQPLSLAVVGFVLGHGLVTSRKVNALENELENLAGELRLQQATPTDTTSPSAAQSQPAESAQPAPADVTPAPPQPQSQPQPQPQAQASVSAPEPDASTEWPTGPERRQPSLLTTGINSAVAWLTTGNIFMKVGIGLLFLGVGFLLNYVAGRGFFTLEMRLTAIAIASIAGLVVGQRLLPRRREYALMLQGAAIGVLYLDIFAAFSMYDLLPATLAFALLAAVSGLAATLAVLQVAPALAFAGFAGGFLAPVLASSGSGNHVGLFSYYVVLNAAILGIAWFRSWRSLNLLGLYFTFAIGVMWGMDGYHPDKYASTQPFLALFFVFFVAISVLYARRQPPQLKGYVDASLIFAPPVLAFSLQLVLMKPFEYGAAWSAFAFGAFYIVLTAALWRQRKAGERLLVEVFLALGVIFSTLVIPFALGAADTAGAWALEGAGMVWIGLRQNRVQARLLGLVLQAGAAFFWLAHQPSGEQQMFINSSYLAGVMIALACFFSARLYRTSPSQWEAPLGSLFIALFVAWWYGIGFREISQFVTNEYMPNWIVGYTAASALMVFELAKRWDWTAMGMTSLLAPGPLLFAAAYLAFFLDSQPHAHFGWLIWTLALAAYGWMLLRCENVVEERFLAIGHIAWAIVLLGVVQWESTWFALEILSLEASWLVAWVALLPILSLQIIHRATFWPVVDWPVTYAGWISAGIALLLSFYILLSLGLTGAADPLPWVPLLNPLDLVTLLAVFAVYTAGLDMLRLFPALARYETRQTALFTLGISLFAWLNVTLFRSLHHWRDLPYDLGRMLDNSFAQSSLSILWVAVGMAVVVVAARLATRTLWIAGAVLLAIVVLKLFVQDLANTGSLERIVSFLGVGGVLVLIGYFSPLPPKKEGGMEQASGANL